jgi:Family of unknown function (DUF5709)
MSDSERHESEDLEDYETLDATDTLDGNPGDDPLDRGVATPDRWSAGIRYAEEGEEESESLDELLSEEEPDVADDPGEDDWDENATEEEIVRYERDDGPDPRAGRLLSEDQQVDDEDDTLVAEEDELVARDEGIDGGGASAEEAALHVIDGSDVPYSDDE